MNCILNYTIPYKPYPLTDFLRFGSGKERFYFESNQSPLAIAGLGIAAQISGTGENRFANLTREVQDFFQHVHQLTDNTPRPVLLGGGSFFAEMKPGKWDSFPHAALVLPRYVLTRIKGEFYFSVNLPLHENESITHASQRLQLEAEAFLARMESAALSSPSILNEININETSRAVWESTINRSVEMIREDRIKKVVLARPIQVTGDHAVDVPVLLEYLGESCPSCFRFLFEFTPGTTFAGATPERLVSVSGARFTTAAIAGSIRRGDFPAEDKILGKQLLDSAKDQSEHLFVRDQILEKMSPLAKSLNIDSAPRLLRLPNIQHLRTDITGTLHADHSILNIVSALHPTPAVGGVPSEAALNVIREIEGFERGWYAAPVGWVDANGDGDFVVAIRSGLFHGKTNTLFGGAGIVADSDPQKEWDETGLKIGFLLNAMQCELA